MKDQQPLEQAKLAYAQQNYQEALQQLNLAINQKPQPEHYLWRILTRMSSNQYYHAMQDCEKVTEFSLEKTNKQTLLISFMTCVSHGLCALMTDHYDIAFKSLFDAELLKIQHSKLLKNNSSQLMQAMAAKIMVGETKINTIIPACKNDSDLLCLISIGTSLHVLSDNFPKAIEKLNTSISKKHSSALSDYLRRGMLYYKMGQYQSALADLSQVISQTRQFPSAYLYRGKTLLKQSSADYAYSLAQEDFQNAVKYLKTAEVDYQLSRILLHQIDALALDKQKNKNRITSFKQNYKKTLERVITLDPFHYRALRDYAALLFKQNKVDLAIEQLSQAIDITNSLDPKLLLLRGKYFKKQEKHQDALADFTRVIELTKNQSPLNNEKTQKLTQLTIDAWHEIGLINEMFGDIENAFSAFNKACELDLSSTQSHLALAKVCLQLFAKSMEQASSIKVNANNNNISPEGILQTALAQLNIALNRAFSIEALMLRATINQMLDHVKDCILDCCEIIAQEPHHLEARLLRGSMLFAQNKLLAALEDFNTIPDHPEAARYKQLIEHKKNKLSMLSSFKTTSSKQAKTEKSQDKVIATEELRTELEIKNVRLSQLQVKLSEKSNQIELLLKQLQDLKLEIAQLQATNVTLENTLTNNKRQLEASNITATDAQKNVYALQKNLETLRKQKNHIEKTYQQAKQLEQTLQQQIKDLQQKDDIKTAKIIELEQQKQHLDEKINELEEALLQQQAAATKQSMETAKEITKKTDYVAMEPSFKIDFNLIPFLILPPAIKDLMKQFEAQGYHILLTGSATYSNNPSDYDFITDAPEPNKILPCAASPDKLGLSQLFHDQLQMPIDISYRPTEVFTNIEKFQQEAKSRVINSDTLFVDSDGNGYDPLQCGVAVTSGDNACEFIDGNDELLKNDPIQILRIIRRCAENNFLLGASSIQLIKANAKYVSQLKPREFWQEMSKLLLRGFAHQSFVLLHTTNVLESLFPDYQVTFITDQRYKNVILNLLTMLQNIDHKPSMEALCGHLFAGSLIWAIKKEQIPTKNFPQKLDTLINQSLFACFNIEEIKTTALQIAPNFLPKSHYGSKPRNYAPTVFDQKPTTAKPVQQKSTSQATKSVVKVKPTEETTINTTTTAKTM